MRLFNKIENVLVLLFIIGFFINNLQAQVAINNDNSVADASAILDIKSTDKGILIPQMTINQRNGIVNPVNGLMIYCSDDNVYYYYNNSQWNPVNGGADDDWTIDNSNIYSALTGNVGIGTSSPSQQLELSNSMKLPYTTSSTVGVVYKDTAHYLHDYLRPGTVGGNLFLGHLAGNFTMGGANNEQGTYNVGIGDSTLASITTGSYNTLVQGDAILGHKMTTANSNTTIGDYGNNDLVSGNNCIAAGRAALIYNKTGSRNIGIGNYSIFGVRGSDNIGIGHQVGSDMTEGNHNMYIGIGIKLLDITKNDQLNIGNVIFGTEIDGSGSNISSGKIGIGVIEPQKKLHVNGDVMFGDYVQNSFTDIWVTSNNTVFAQNPYSLGKTSFKFEIPDHAGSHYSFKSGSTELLRLTADTKLGLGTSSPDYELQVNGIIAPETNGQSLGTLSLRWDAKMNTIIVDSVVVNSKINISETNTPPTATEGSLWVDNSVSPPQIKCFLNSVWVRLDNE